MMSDAPCVRSVFFYNSMPALGDTAGLHFFEPRYRLLVQRALTEKHRKRQFLYLPNFVDYQSAHGDIGYLCTIVEHRPVPVPDPQELPRADVRIRFDQRAVVLFHWIESNTGGLSECICRPLDRALLPLDEAWLSVHHAELSHCLKRCQSESNEASVRVLASAPHQHPELPHFLLHSSSDEVGRAAVASIEASVPGASGLVLPVVMPPVADTVPLSKVIRRLAALWMRLSRLSTLKASIVYPPPSTPFTPPPPSSSSSLAPSSPSLSGAACASDELLIVSDEQGQLTQPAHHQPAQPTQTAAAALAPSSLAGGGAKGNGSTEGEAADGNGSVAMGEDERAAAVLKALPVRELKSRLAELKISPSAGCLEKEDLVALLTAAERRERLVSAVTEAAGPVAAALAGVHVPLACGCPSETLYVRTCEVAKRPRDPSSTKLYVPRAGSLWGVAHSFGVTQRYDSNVGQVCVAVYGWERRNLGFGYDGSDPAGVAGGGGVGSDGGGGGLGMGGEGGDGDEEAEATASELPSASQSPAASAPDRDVVIAPSDDRDAAAALSHACAVQLGSVSDGYANILLPPNLVRISRSDELLAVSRLAMRLHWPRVRLLFIGHDKAPTPNTLGTVGAGRGSCCTAVTSTAAAADVSAGAEDGGSGGSGGSGCLFALLDRELLWVIAEWIIALERSDGRIVALV